MNFVYKLFYRGAQNSKFNLKIIQLPEAQVKNRIEKKKSLSATLIFFSGFLNALGSYTLFCVLGLDWLLLFLHFYFFAVVNPVSNAAQFLYLVSVFGVDYLFVGNSISDLVISFSVFASLVASCNNLVGEIDKEIIKFRLLEKLFHGRFRVFV